MALFTDTLGEACSTPDRPAGDPVRRRSPIAVLGQCSASDLVVVAFSCHGTPGHHLATYDTDPADLATTAIPLSLLGTWFAGIPARRLLCVIDAMLLRRDRCQGLHPRNRRRRPAGYSVRPTLRRRPVSADRGMCVGTGLGDEPLRPRPADLPPSGSPAGRRGGARGGKVRYTACSSTSRGASPPSGRPASGRPQHPTLRGQLDGELTWPVFPRRRATAPLSPSAVRATGHGRPPEPGAFGFPPELLAAWAGSIPALNELQLDAINEFGLLGASTWWSRRRPRRARRWSASWRRCGVPGAQARALPAAPQGAGQRQAPAIQPRPTRRSASDHPRDGRNCRRHPGPDARAATTSA